MQYYISKDSFGFRYKETPVSGWKYLPDCVRSAKDILPFLTKNGLRDRSSVEFVDNHNKRLTYFQVQRKGSYFDAVDHNERNLRIYNEDLFPIPDQLVFFDTVQDERSAEISDNWEKLAYLKGKSDQGTLDLYNEMYELKTSDDAVKRYIEEHCLRNYSLPALVEFQ